MARQRAGAKAEDGAAALVPPALSERGIIASLEAGLKVALQSQKLPLNPAAQAEASRVLLGIGDDAAVLRLGPLDSGRRLNASDTVLTTDLLIEGVHFDLRYMSLADVAYKALMVSLSDCASMGARPSFALGQLGVPPSTSQQQIDSLLAGVYDAQEYSVRNADLPLQFIGGDTVAAPQWIIGFTVLAELHGEPLRRSGARPGDGIWLSGQPGLAQCGLNVLTGSVAGGRSQRPAPADYPQASAALRRPAAELQLGLWLHIEGLASACLDTSDSLSQSLLLLAQASSVGLLVDLSKPELHPEVLAFTQWLKQRRRLSTEAKAALNLPAFVNPGGSAQAFDSVAQWLLAGSEDYGLLFTAPQSATLRLLREAPTALQRIGTVVDAGEGQHHRCEDGKLYPLDASGYQHFPPA